jgi:hypothetical protein
MSEPVDETTVHEHGAGSDPECDGGVLGELYSSPGDIGEHLADLYQPPPTAVRKYNIGSVVETPFGETVYDHHAAHYRRGCEGCDVLCVRDQNRIESGSTNPSPQALAKQGAEPDPRWSTRRSPMVTMVTLATVALAVGALIGAKKL